MPGEGLVADQSSYPLYQAYPVNPPDQDFKKKAKPPALPVVS